MDQKRNQEGIDAMNSFFFVHAKRGPRSSPDEALPDMGKRGDQAEVVDKIRRAQMPRPACKVLVKDGVKQP